MQYFSLRHKYIMSTLMLINVFFYLFKETEIEVFNLTLLKLNLRMRCIPFIASHENGWGEP